MTECPHCSRKFKTFEAYAQHILDKHSDDEIRAGWASEVLRPEEEPEQVEQEPSEEERKDRVAEQLADLDEVEQVLSEFLKPEVVKLLKEKRGVKQEETP